MRKVELSILVTVNDEEKLREYAEQRYRDCWQSDLDAEATLAEAVLEALVLSNENPSPDTYGINIDESGALEVHINTVHRPPLPQGAPRGPSPADE